LNPCWREMYKADVNRARTILRASRRRAAM
jgi:hypothetical protein